MRAFFVTAAMYAGKDALWITDRTGHTSLGMLRTYERDVRGGANSARRPSTWPRRFPSLLPPPRQQKWQHLWTNQVRRSR
jgi:hypothetical protein